MTTTNKQRERALRILWPALIASLVVLGHVSGIAKGERQARAECVELGQ